MDRNKLLEANIKMEQNLKAQYEKEYADALAGKGLCAGMPDYMLNGVQRELATHIESCESAIKLYEKELKENGN